MKQGRKPHPSSVTVREEGRKGELCPKSEDQEWEVGEHSAHGGGGTVQAPVLGAGVWRGGGPHHTPLKMIRHNALIIVSHVSRRRGPIA